MMKKRLRYTGLLLALVLTVGLFAACRTVPPTMHPPISITEEFVITRPTRSTDAEETAARDLRAALDAIGIKVFVKDDWYKDVDDIPKNEILIGKTNRDESAAATKGLSERDYAISVRGSAENGYKIVIAAGGDKGIAAGVEYFISTYLTSAEPNKIPATLSYQYTFEFPCEDITVSDHNISMGDYTIVYAKEGVTSPVDPNYQTFIQTAKYADAAEALADAIAEATNARPKVVSDQDAADDGTPKIYFGKTDLAADDFAYQSAFTDAGAYIAKLTVSGDIILAGDNACSAYAAGETLIDAMIEAKTHLSALDVSATKDLIKVACIGDSITHGTTSDDESAYNYPVYLQRMLGYDYYVEKYGAPGFSLTSSDTYSYMSYSAMYKGSQDAKPDVVIIMLGTNDCNPFDDYKDWTNASRSRTFKTSAETMIKAYKRANSKVQIYFMTPPTVPQNQNWADNVKNYAVPLITEVAQKNKCNLIDLYSWSLKNTSTFTADGGDGLHPKNEHYAELAEAVYEGLKDTIQKPQN